MSSEVVEIRQGEDVPEGAVFVPEKLRVEQHVFDQPPFAWVLRDASLIPARLLKERRKNLYRFLDAVLASDSENSSTREMVIRWVGSKYARGDKFVEVMRTIREKLQKSYPYILDYYRHVREEFYFGGREGIGPKIRAEKPWIDTYACYAFRRARQEQEEKLFGMQEVLPDGYSLTRHS